MNTHHSIKELLMQKPKRELTKNGRGVSAQLTQSEYEEWVKLGKGKWLRSFLKDSRFERKANGNDTRSQG
jgi:predicted nucleic acid-binding Zn finger protein